MKSVLSLFDNTKFCIAFILWSANTVIKQCLFTEFLTTENAFLKYFKEASSKIGLLKIPRKLKSEVWKQLILLYQAHIDAYQWVDVYKNHIYVLMKCDQRLNFVNDPQYRFISFLTPTGEFDDVKWVKKFIHDPQQTMKDRFYLACMYCLEADIELLKQMISGDQACSEYFNRRHIRSIEPSVVTFWREDMHNERSVFLENIKMAISSDHERAVAYIWGKLSTEERTLILSDINECISLIFLATDNLNFKFVHFVYSQLSLQQQLLVLKHDLTIHRGSRIWNVYLLSPSYKCILKQVKHFRDLLPPIAYSGVINTIACCLIERNMINPFDNNDDDYNYEKLLCQVWNLGSAIGKDFVFQFALNVLERLFIMKKFNCIKMLFKDSTLEHKRHFLFSPSESKIIKSYIDDKDWESFEKHLLLFLMDLGQEDLESKLKPFHAYSLDLLKQFQEDSWFAKELTGIPNEYAKPFLTILKNVRQEVEISNLLNDLIEAV